MKEEIPSSETIPWETGRWTHRPAQHSPLGTSLLVTAAEGSDAWRHTGYGFVHDSAHALLAPLPVGQAMEVTFRISLREKFDQAGIYLHTSDRDWLKAGVELSDGQLQRGAVVTRGRSDWSLSPCTYTDGQEVTLRLSRGPDWITLRISGEGEPFTLLRLVPWPQGTAASAGPYCCSPTRAGLTVAFTQWTRSPADTSVHP